MNLTIFILLVIVFSLMLTMTALSSVILFWSGVVFGANLTGNYESRTTQIIAFLFASIPWIPLVILLCRALNAAVV